MPALRATFRPASRLRHKREFEAVFATQTRRARGPIVVFGRPNDLGRPRLGLSISRRAGGAVTRNAIKRRLREAFRLSQHDLPQGMDFVITVRPHTLMPPIEYQRLLVSAARSLAKHSQTPEAPP